MREDLPLCLDPFLLWKSEDPHYRELHNVLLGFVEQVRTHALTGHVIAAQRLLAEVREPVELGLGYAAGTKRGSAIGPALSTAIIETFRQVPQLESAGLGHLEILALLVPRIAEDRISELTASVIKRWLAEFTSIRCKDLGVPTRRYRLTAWDADRLDWRPFDARLPYIEHMVVRVREARRACGLPVPLPRLVGHRTPPRPEGRGILRRSW